MTQLTEDFKFSTAFVLLKQTSAILFGLRNILKFLSDCFMDLRYFWLSLFLVCGLWSGAFCDQDGFLSLSCGGTTSFIDSSNISWVPDSTYVSTGNISMVDFIEDSISSRLQLRFFPFSQGRNCYKLPVENQSSVVLIRAKFVYKNYDGLKKPPSFSVSLGTALTSSINLAESDPWIEEFIWPVNKDILPLCLQAIPDGSFPVVSTLEVRPIPQGAYDSGMGVNKLLKKCHRINCGYTNGSLRYPLDRYDRIWDADKNFSPIRLATGFNSQLSFNLSILNESPPIAVLQTARVLARRNILTYNFPIKNLGDYYIVLYFAGILRVSPTFDILINEELAQSNYTIKMSQVSALFFTRKAIKSLTITFKSTSSKPQVNAIEVYEIVDIPLETSSTTVSALEVIQQSTGLNLGWEDDPCFPIPWDHIGCEGSLVTSLYVYALDLTCISYFPFCQGEGNK